MRFAAKSYLWLPFLMLAITPALPEPTYKLVNISQIYAGWPSDIGENIELHATLSCFIANCIATDKSSAGSIMIFATDIEQYNKNHIKNLCDGKSRSLCNAIVFGKISQNYQLVINTDSINVMPR